MELRTVALEYAESMNYFDNHSCSRLVWIEVLQTLLRCRLSMVSALRKTEYILFRKVFIFGMSSRQMLELGNYGIELTHLKRR